MSRSEREISNELLRFKNITEENIDSFEELVSDALESRKKSLIFPLLSMLDDACEFDEVMFGVVHALEKFSWEEYFSVLSSNVSKIWEKSPRWCGILHTRIINSPAAYDVFLHSFFKAPEDQVNIEKTILLAISKKEKFRDRCLFGIEKLKEIGSADREG